MRPIQLDVPMGKRTHEIKTHVCEDTFGMVAAMAAMRRQKVAEYLHDLVRRDLYGRAHELILADISSQTRPATSPVEGEV